MISLKKYTIAEIVNIISGGTPKTSVSEYWGGNIPWLSVKDFNNGHKRVYSSEKSITKLGLENSATSILDVNDIIISARGTVGVIAQIGWPMSFNQSCYGLKAKKDKVNENYLYYLLKCEITQIKQSTHGSVFDTITRDTFDKLYVSVPPLPTQRRIAAILSSLDDKIENNRKTCEKLEEIAQALFKRWFVDFEFPNEDRLPYKSSGGKMVYCGELGKEIPKGWGVIKFGTIIDIRSGERPTNKSERKSEKTMIPLAGASKIMGYTDNFNFDEPILVIGRVGTHGIIQRFYSRVWASDNTLVIKSKLFEFCNKVLGSIDYAALNKGSTQPLITQTDIKNYQVIGPPNFMLQQFEDIASSMSRVIKNMEDESAAIKQIRDALLPKLMSGELAVDEGGV